MPEWHHRGRAQASVLHRDVIYPRLSGVRCGSAMMDVARSSDALADAARLRSSSSITSCRTRREAQLRQITSSCAAGRTTSMRRLFFGDTLVGERPEVWVEHTRSDRSHRCPERPRGGYGSSDSGAGGVSSSSPWDTGRPSMISRARLASAAATATVYSEVLRAGIPR
jgi:hypothetical protein